MTKKSTFKLVVYGLLQWFILNITIFVASLIFGINRKAEMTTPPPLGFALVAVIMVGVSYAFGRWLKPTSRKQVVIAGLVWSGMTTVFMLVTVFGNGTQGVILGHWASYLMFIAQVIGSLFVGVKKIDAGNT